MDYTLINANYSPGITSPDLLAEIASLEASGTPYETALAEIAGVAQRAQLLYVPSEGRGGVAWGGDAQWLAAASMFDLMAQFQASLDTSETERPYTEGIIGLVERYRWQVDTAMGLKFEAAVAAYLDAPIYPSPREAVAEIRPGVFFWERSRMEMHISPEGVRIPDEENVTALDLEWAENARQFGLASQKLWDQLPPAARTSTNLIVLAIAEHLKEYAQAQG